MKNLAQAADVSEIHDRFRRLVPTDAGRWGCLTVQEMVCHVRDSYEGAMGQRVVEGVAKRPPIPLGLYKWLALKFPREWPKGVETMPEVNPRMLGTRPAEFGSDLELLLGKLAEFSAFGGPFPAHPIFGPMTDGEWKRWGYLHADHHLRQFGR